MKSGHPCLAAAGNGSHHAGGDCGQGIGGWLGNGDGLEGDECWSYTRAPGGQEDARRIILADGVVAVIRSVEVARCIEGQALWVVQIIHDLAEKSTRRIELADGVVTVIRGVEVARDIERQAGWRVHVRHAEIADVSTRRIELADSAVAVIRGVEVARGERQALWAVQIQVDNAVVCTRRIVLIDSAVTVIRSVEVARGIERQPDWAVQKRVDIAVVSTRRIELADGVAAVIRGVEVARGIEHQALWIVQIRSGEKRLGGLDSCTDIACGVVFNDSVVAQRDKKQIHRPGKRAGREEKGHGGHE